MAEKGRCDACGKEVGTAALYRRIGFLPGSRLNQVCGTCHTGKLTREDRLRFTKGTAARRKGAAAGDDDAEHDPARAPDELRGLGGG